MYTYILGAGASHPTLPLAKDMSKSLVKFMNTIGSVRTNQTIVSHRDRDYVNTLYEDLTNMIKNSSRHQTIDTYARMLSLTHKEQSYKQLCELLTLYFLYEQSFKSTHNRYDHFLATVLKEDSLKIPDEFMFLSWNYDFQFEKAMSLYLDNASYIDCANQLNLVSANAGNQTQFDASFIKLNGTAFFPPPYNSGVNEFGMFREYANEIKSIKYIIDLYVNICQDSQSVSSSLSFAWSKNKGMVIETNKERLQNTKILIIIGYSFPYFNRSIDLQIIKYFTGLDKIIIQAPSDYASQLESKIKAMWPHHYEPPTEIVTDISQFFIPYEYNSILIPSPDPITFL